MLHLKTYNLITLANHRPSLWVREMVEEYRKDGEGFTHVKLWLVTNNYSMKDLKKQFKFDDLPCLVVTEQIASNRKHREHYYKDEIEQIVRSLAKKEMRDNARSTVRESTAALRLRLHKAKREYKRDVIPAAEDVQEDTGNMPKVSKRKGKRSKKATADV